jgi:predicted CxxxxCH...CXXCH cytochrome family protein
MSFVRVTFRVASAAVCLAALATACLEVRDEHAADGGPQGCDYCHAELGGAHYVLLNGTGPLGTQLDCVECHPVPDDWFVPGHIDGVVDVRFPEGSLALTGGLDPQWDGALCTQTYCHGATMPGAAYPEPRWTDVFPEGLACDACHGDPPPGPHPIGEECQACHPAAYTAAGGLDPAVHLNGTVETDVGGKDHGVGP